MVFPVQHPQGAAPQHPRRHNGQAGAVRASAACSRAGSAGPFSTAVNRNALVYCRFREPMCTMPVLSSGRHRAVPLIRQAPRPGRGAARTADPETGRPAPAGGCSHRLHQGRILGQAQRGALAQDLADKLVTEINIPRRSRGIFISVTGRAVFRSPALFLNVRAAAGHIIAGRPARRPAIDKYPMGVYNHNTPPGYYQSREGHAWSAATKQKTVPSRRSKSC